MYFEYAVYSDLGCRDNNEDSYDLCSREDTLITVVADGLGGHANGEVASRVAVDTILESLEDKQTDEDELCLAVLAASKAIERTGISGLTTVASLWIQDSLGVAAHVGDSRIYQFRNGKIIFQSVDHSVVQMGVLVGDMDPDAVRHHRDRNKLFRVLGEPDNPPRVDSTELNVRPGDAFLLCSDGFWEPVLEEDMLRTLDAASTAQQWLEAMREIVYAAQDPKQDNNTAVCVIVR